MIDFRRSTVGKNKLRFQAPTVLRADAPFLGATVQEWDDAFTGNMDKSLAKVKKLALTRASVQFVDDKDPPGPLPMFVTRTSLNFLLVEDREDDTIG
jgi:hypothetical protein